MYQNTTLIPLVGSTGQVDHIGILIYDVTDVAINRIDLKAANETLQTLSRTDRLTGLFNRGYWEECLNTEFKRCKRTARPSSVLIFDIDHFKKVNDTYGHPAGDQAIKATANMLLETMRETDIAGRYGGEEYVVILINTTAEQALIYAERLRKKIAETIVHHQGIDISYTISLGICQMADDIPSYSEWIERADQALYQSKTNGRNQASIYQKS
jgi:diguanylate cyclase (GGDEF)-like protein